MNRIFTLTILSALTVALSNTSVLAMRDPGMGSDLYDYARAASPPRLGQAGFNNQYADGMNLYQYVRSNPNKYLDPKGTNAYITGGTGHTGVAVDVWCDEGGKDKKIGYVNFDFILSGWGGLGPPQEGLGNPALGTSLVSWQFVPSTNSPSHVRRLVGGSDRDKAMLGRLDEGKSSDLTKAIEAACCGKPAVASGTFQSYIDYSAGNFGGLNCYTWTAWHMAAYANKDHGNVSLWSYNGLIDWFDNGLGDWHEPLPPPPDSKFGPEPFPF